MEKTTTTTTNKKDGKVQPLFSSLQILFRFLFRFSSFLFSSLLFSGLWYSFLVKRIIFVCEDDIPYEV
jgi:hypothetical protein